MFCYILGYSPLRIHPGKGNIQNNPIGRGSTNPVVFNPPACGPPSPRVGGVQKVPAVRLHRGDLVPGHHLPGGEAGTGMRVRVISDRYIQYGSRTGNKYRYRYILFS